MKKYITKSQFEENPGAFSGEVNEEPSMTIEGEYMEMKDILKHAMQGQGMSQYKGDAQYFRPEEISQINSMYKNSLDLTDIDKLQNQTTYMQNQITEARRRKEEKEAELKSTQQENEKQNPSKSEE